MLPFKSLDAVTADGAGVVHDLEGVYSDHTLSVVFTGTPGGTVYLEGSHDGVNFFSMASAAVNANRMVRPIDTNRFAVRYVRANLTGASGSVVTAYVASR